MEMEPFQCKILDSETALKAKLTHDPIKETHIMSEKDVSLLIMCVVTLDPKQRKPPH